MNCILCINATAEFINIHDRIGKALNIPEVISKHFWFTVDESSETHICVDCWKHTSSFNLFYDRVLDAHRKNSTENIIPINRPFESQYLSTLPGTVAGYHLGKPFKTEAIAEDQQNENESPMPHLIKYESIAPPNVSPVTVKLESCYDDSTLHNDASFNDDSDDNDDGTETDTETNSNTKDRDETADTDELDVESKMADYFRMNCDLCSVALESMADIQQHFKNMHNINRGYLRCCDCSNRKFRMRKQIVDHVTWHLDPTAFQCKKCLKTFTEESRLVTHKASHHMDDDKLIFNCHVCEKRFGKQHILNEHVRRVHPPDDQSFACDICQKEYKTKKLLHNHIQTVHNRKDTKHICDICARVMSSKHSLKEHVKTHTDGERFKCDECGSMLKSQSSLIKHKKMHTDVEQTCDICFKVKPNASALRNHVRNVHSEAKHKCTYCDKAFRRSMSLKEHVATHTGEVLYTCSFCSTTFKSSANKFKHYRQVHFEEWKANKKVKK
ncbi:transcription factor grauzone-like [Bradysia coprophila]|uniref:transcription factor grauzone-like n=1 Tax=Bradysia coprophila TaxID=38358 RepID=UPI00187DA7DD|nr:transcription factor grauzone-like [Bradysia coprophila]